MKRRRESEQDLPARARVLDGARLFFLPFGWDMTQKRLDVVKTGARKFGAHVVELPPRPTSSAKTVLDHLQDEGATHIVTSDATVPPITFPRLCAFLCNRLDQTAVVRSAATDNAGHNKECRARVLALLVPSASALPVALTSHDHAIAAAVAQHHASSAWRPKWVTVRFVTRILRGDTQASTAARGPDLEDYDCHGAILQSAEPSQSPDEGVEEQPLLATPERPVPPKYEKEPRTPPPHVLGGTRLTRGQLRLMANRHKFACQSPKVPRSPLVDVSTDKSEEEAVSEDELEWSGASETHRRRLASPKMERGETVAVAVEEHKVSAEALPPPLLNHNPHITAMLRRLQALYEQQTTEPWRARNYSIAASTVSNLPFKIEDPKDLDRKEVRLGKKTKEKIAEFLRTGTVKKLEALEEDPRLNVIRLFTGVFGIAGTTAEKLYTQGYRSLEDLRKNKHVLTQNQQIGLEFYEELQQPIPRPEVHMIVGRVKRAARKLFSRAELSVIACGSFRRGNKECGDVDILFCKRSDQPFEDELHRIVEALHQVGLLTHDLVDLSPRRGKHHNLSYMGICQVSADRPHRRIDLKMYSNREYAFALLHFTGSVHFSRSIRLFAKKLGYQLTDHGLYLAIRQPGEKTVNRRQLARPSSVTRRRTSLSTSGWITGILGSGKSILLGRNIWRRRRRKSLVPTRQMSQKVPPHS